MPTADADGSAGQKPRIIVTFLAGFDAAITPHIRPHGGPHACIIAQTFIGQTFIGQPIIRHAPSPPHRF